MEHKSYWGFNEYSQTTFRETKNIFDIMEYQCKELAKHTNGNVFGIFGEIKKDGSLFRTASIIASVLKSVSGTAEITESVGEMSTKELIDADGMYFQKPFAFEICTDKYRFRVFSIVITPVYPVTITINDGVCKNIAGRIKAFAQEANTENSYLIEDEEAFCDILQEILADKKVHYIVNELHRRCALKQEPNEKLPEKVIICEGQVDEIILHAVAQKLNQSVTIVTANGGYSIPTVFSSIKKKNTQTKILIVIDSDGNEGGVRATMEASIGQAEYELAVVNNSIEDWFAADITDFSKLKLMQSIGAILDGADFNELSEKHESFAQVVRFLGES